MALKHNEHLYFGHYPVFCDAMPVLWPVPVGYLQSLKQLCK